MIMICKDDFKESKLTYFNEGYMNKLYTCEVNGEKCLVRINDNPINKIYEYSYLFENFFELSL